VTFRASMSNTLAATVSRPRQGKRDSILADAKIGAPRCGLFAREGRVLRVPKRAIGEMYARAEQAEAHPEFSEALKGKSEVTERAPSVLCATAQPPILPMPLTHGQSSTRPASSQCRYARRRYAVRDAPLPHLEMYARARESPLCDQYARAKEAARGKQR